MVVKYGCSSSRAYHHMHTEFRAFIKAQYPDCTCFITGGKRYDPLPNNCGREFEVANFSPDFRKYPKNKFGFRAFYIRNKQIAYVCDTLIALWDGKSRGTKMTIDLARKFGKQVDIWTLKDGAFVPYVPAQRTLDDTDLYALKDNLQKRGLKRCF